MRSCRVNLIGSGYVSLAGSSCKKIILNFAFLNYIAHYFRT
jgi:hypothetical protein